MTSQAANTDRNEVAQRMLALLGRDEALASATRMASSCVTEGYRNLWSDVAALLRLETQSDEQVEPTLSDEAVAAFLGDVVEHRDAVASGFQAIAEGLEWMAALASCMNRDGEEVTE